eukprot:2988167-Prymnesium_polylepis.2
MTIVGRGAPNRRSARRDPKGQGEIPGALVPLFLAAIAQGGAKASPQIGAPTYSTRGGEKGPQGSGVPRLTASRIKNH